LGKEGSDDLSAAWDSSKFPKEPTGIITYELQLLVFMNVIYGYQD
jgi:hypothetical protein